jgi:hypothetical protein
MSTCEPKKSEIARADNRSAFPNTAAIVDEFKNQFGSDQVRLLYGEEAGKTIGNKLPEPVYFKTVAQWLQGSELIRQEQVRKDAKPLPPSINGYVRGRR